LSTILSDHLIEV